MKSVHSILHSLKLKPTPRLIAIGHRIQQLGKAKAAIGRLRAMSQKSGAQANHKPPLHPAKPTSMNSATSSMSPDSIYSPRPDLDPTSLYQGDRPAPEPENENPSAPST